MESKKCCSCQRTLILSRFTSKNGLVQGRCKECNTAYQSERMMIKNALKNPALFRKCKTCGRHFNAGWGGRRKDGTLPLVKECKYCGSDKIIKADLSAYVADKLAKKIDRRKAK
jgi:DNA-directed RNA polymerase subunit RPC12/RpoP